MLLEMTKSHMPQMTESAYLKVRDAFRRALPAKVTATWIMANVEGYRAESSARSLIVNLRRFSLIDKEGVPTDIARQWRCDETYATACDVIIRNAFPPDLVDAVSGSLPAAELMTNLFMSHGVGLGSAKNLTRIFRLIASRALPVGEPKTRPNRERIQKKTEVRKTEVRAQESQAQDADETRRASAPGSGSELTVLRYFLERGRLAEVRVPADMDAKERRRLFAHLKIDLLDEVTE